MEKLIAKTAHLVPELCRKALLGDPTAAAKLAFLGALAGVTLLGETVQKMQEKDRRA